MKASGGMVKRLGIALGSTCKGLALLIAGIGVYMGIQGTIPWRMASERQGLEGGAAGQLQLGEFYGGYRPFAFVAFD